MQTARTLAPGTCVKVKGNELGYRNPFAVVVEHERGGGVVVQTEGSGRVRLARHEVQAVRNPPAQPLKFLRQRMPYGKWTCSDGREILFNRDYEPIWQRHLNQAAEPADQHEWVLFEREEERFYSDPPWRSAEAERRCNQILGAWGLPVV